MFIRGLTGICGSRLARGLMFTWVCEDGTCVRTLLFAFRDHNLIYLWSIDNGDRGKLAIDCIRA